MNVLKILCGAMKRSVMGSPINVISIIGTTGVGKSQFSIELAKRYNGEIINADSMQMYKRLDIITNKHPIEEREGIEHHVMNHVDWDKEYVIHRFREEAMAKIKEIHERGKVPIIVGGTHYYLQSLLFNNKTIKTNEQILEEDDEMRNLEKKLTREELNILNDSSPAELYSYLQKIDPIVSEKFHPNDSRRIKRCIEIFFLTKKRASDYYDEQAANKKFESSLNFNTLIFWLWSEQSVLAKRLDDRVDKMLAEGGIDEINELYRYYSSLKVKPDCEHGVFQVIGFKEFLPWLDSNSLQDDLFKKSIMDMKTRTRRYAKRQVKWIKNSLARDLASESLHNFSNGGKIYVLNATDLANWNDEVYQRGSSIAKKFLSSDAGQILEPQTPEGLEDLLPSFENNVDDHSIRTQNWKHYECDICKDDNGKPLVFVGEQYSIHLKSRKHRSYLNKGKKKREYEERLMSKRQTL
ncbi:hypothetical protein PACTADRAFT_51074 [Pachysolen tannophilus NRRL Y-2460]|uniref:tRNA dimethylallyltransferase n=1 Tax=Pachysolen tannophilus NRRL Y-2460 TaxID=669874 RepID=A0A1E4TR19_PACTA|nr:hypothetical protein PACTADRAFT_51074 [Pachysolen tannophilus NRRL Y-2460]